jgi:UDPglucose--hexose-1-phosphate uridylyltransferase
MGCSNPHPHGQVWSLSEVPTLPATELVSLTRYAESTSSSDSGAPRGPHGKPCMLCEYVHFELTVPENEGRIVVRNEDWVALVPWWATWPFEILRMIFILLHFSLQQSSVISPQFYLPNVTSPLLLS